jgi:hypothetical protein
MMLRKEDSGMDDWCLEGTAAIGVVQECQYGDCQRDGSIACHGPCIVFIRSLVAVAVGVD